MRYGTPIEPPEHEIEVTLPLWMAQQILWELQSHQSTWVNLLKNRIELAKKEERDYE